MLKRIPIALVFLSFAASPALAGFDEGKKAYDKKDWTTAIRELRPLAEAGDDRAMIIIANMYEDGHGVIRSHKESMRLYKRAATEKNNPQAMDAVGAMYISGIGVDQNLQTALQWFQRSALLGDQAGAFFYATMLFQGNKGQQNPLKPDVYNAYKWYKIAATEKPDGSFTSVSAKMAKGIAAKMLKGDEAAKADSEAAAWTPVDVNTLGPVPVDPPPAPRAPPAPPKTAAPKNSLPLTKSPDNPLPHSEPLQK